jgi:diamine N-acetyltransferase
MDQTVTISLATEKDAELIAELGKETFHDAFAANPLMPPNDLQLYLKTAFTVSQITSEITDPKAIFLVAQIEGEAVGYAKMERGVTATGVTGKNPLKLKRLYAKQKYIGSGIGKCLMKRCLEEAKRLGHDTIWLSVWKHNSQAQNFYRKWNFVMCGEYEFQLGKTKFLDILMQRSGLKS